MLVRFASVDMYCNVLGMIHISGYSWWRPGSGHSRTILCYQLATLWAQDWVCWDFKLPPAHLLHTPIPSSQTQETSRGITGELRLTPQQNSDIMHKVALLCHAKCCCCCGCCAAVGCCWAGHGTHGPPPTIALSWHLSGHTALAHV